MAFLVVAFLVEAFEENQLQMAAEACLENLVDLRQMVELLLDSLDYSLLHKDLVGLAVK